MKITIFAEERKPAGRTIRNILKHLYYNHAKELNWKRYPNGAQIEIVHKHLPESIRNDIDGLAKGDVYVSNAYDFIHKLLIEEGCVNSGENEPYAVLLKDRHSCPEEKLRIIKHFKPNIKEPIVLIDERNALEEDRKIDIL